MTSEDGSHILLVAISEMYVRATSDKRHNNLIRIIITLIAQIEGKGLQ